METTPPRARPVALLLLLVLPLSACAEEREYPAGQRCEAWKQDIGPLLRDQCAGCHGGAEPAGGYGLESYLSALGNGSDGTPNLISGEAGSLLLATIAPGSADEVHAPFTELHPRLRDWVVDCDLAYTSSPIHEPGILNPRDEDFHGKLLRGTGYDFARCAECHGEDFGGGTSGVACTTCHENGPTDCTTCHSRLPELGAHAAHLELPLAFADDCATCHTVPSAWDVPGHVFLADGSLDPPPAEVVLGGLAAADGASEDRQGPPAYRYEASTCDNVYCHGDTYTDLGAMLTTPSWFGGPEQAACGNCHGLPPENDAHPPPGGVGEDCVVCHGRVVDAARNIIAPELHVDGMVQLGWSEDAGCAGCHGSLESPAPPVDLAGQSSPTLRTVGAHQQHLQASLALGRPVRCGDCHLVPDSITSPGHLDGDPGAEVFPPSIAGTSLAFARGAAPRWDPDTETCANVYCHGGGTKLSTDPAAGNQAPTWTAPFDGAVYCGSCHGIPPRHAGHPDSVECFHCHASSVNEFYMLTSEHLDGEVDF